jgi:hypothetical protein
VREDYPMEDPNEPTPGAEITLLVGPGYPGESELILRISPEQTEFLRECLEAEGLYASSVIEHSANSWLDVLAVSLGSGGALTALIVALQKFLDRHDGKTVVFRPDGQVESMSGYSAKDVAAVVEVSREKQQEVDKQWASTFPDGETPAVAPGSADDVDPA